MPRKDGTLSASELRRLIKQHNKLMSIQIPKGTNRDGLIKLITKNGYTINHSAQKLEPTKEKKKKPVVNLPPPPVKKTAEEKKQAKDKRDKKRREIEAEGIKKALALQKVRNMKKPLQKNPEPKSEPKSESESDKPTKNDLSNYQKQVDDNIDNMKKLGYIRGLIYNITEKYTKGTKVKPTTDFIYEKRRKEPIIVDMLKLVDKIDKRIKDNVNKQKPKKEEAKKEEPKKEEQKKSQSLIDKENDIKKVMKSILTDDLKKAYNDNNKDMMKKLYNKKLNEIAKLKSKYSGKSVSTEKKQLQKMGGIGFAIRKWAEGKKVDSVKFLNVDITNLF